MERYDENRGSNSHNLHKRLDELAQKVKDAAEWVIIIEEIYAIVLAEYEVADNEYKRFLEELREQSADLKPQDNHSTTMLE